MGGARRARGFGAGAGGWDGPAAGARGRALPRMAPRHGSGRAAVGQGAGWAGLRRVRACARPRHAQLAAGARAGRWATPDRHLVRGH